MARPLSEEKRQALLDAAAEFVASLGTGASTAKIAKAAGVSEGTLFTYFPTKDDLLNQLFLEIEADFIGTMMLAPYPADASAKDRLFVIWNRLIDWGLTHATARKALRQLKVSDRVTAESGNRWRDTRTRVEECLAGHAAPDRIA
ncbi:MAG: TetR/AcrR family transcriptional regulator, partial [Sphingomonas sp.]|nr:TetR/AcrR family transcriptional regulator [Sphingomonas sp.]